LRKTTLYVLFRVFLPLSKSEMTGRRARLAMHSAAYCNLWLFSAAYRGQDRSNTAAFSCLLELFEMFCQKSRF
jgi:hypothetical protein